MADEKLKRFALKLRDEVQLLAAKVSQVERIRTVARDGRDGAPGADGKPGAQGPEGERGAQGVAGLPGRDGRDGLPGPKGDSVTKVEVEPGNVLAVWVGEVKTLAGRIVAQRGERGERGPQGPTGPQGPKGRDGKNGKDGQSVTKVELNGRELFVWLDGVKKKAGSITFPSLGAPGSGGGGARVQPPAEVLGWADYADTQYTQGSPLTLLANTDTVLPNNGLAGPKSQAPPGVVFYEDGKITGRNGDGLAITVDFQAVPTSASTTYIEVWIDIGGAIGELYRRIISFPKGQGEMRPVNFTVIGYTLDTWEQNGGTVYVRANGTLDIYNIRYVLTRTHKAR